MKTRTIIALAVILALGMGALLVLRQYKLHLIHVIVENAIIQKAPEGYPRQTIVAAFDAHLNTAKQLDREDAYLTRLLEASQRLEKVQRLSAPELDQLLAELDPADPRRPAPIP
jgi:hypothetical protein